MLIGLSLELKRCLQPFVGAQSLSSRILRSCTSSIFARMSNVGYLLERYTEHPRLIALRDALSTPRARVRITGLVGSQRALVVGASVRQLSRLFVCVCNDKEEAAYLLNDLQSLLGEGDVCFFPDSFRRPAVFEHLNATQTLQRSEVVNRLTMPHRRGWAVVTYPEALFEEVVSPEVLTKSRIEIVKGERLDLDFVLQVLVEYGLVRTDFVYEPGQFSLRGGILDLFSFGNEYPYRVELFDAEVESIRTFDPLTQLSRQNIERLQIVPNWSTAHTREEKTPLLRVLPEDAVLWIEDVQFLLDRLLRCFDEAERYAARIGVLDAEEVRAILQERAFVRPYDVLKALQSYALVFGNPPTDPTFQEALATSLAR